MVCCGKESVFPEEKDGFLEKKPFLKLDLILKSITRQSHTGRSHSLSYSATGLPIASGKGQPLRMRLTSIRLQLVMNLGGSMVRAGSTYVAHRPFSIWLKMFRWACHKEVLNFSVTVTSTRAYAS